MSEWTIKKALEWTEGYLADKGDENPRLSAQWLLSEACGLSRTQLFVNFDRPLSRTSVGCCATMCGGAGPGALYSTSPGEVAFRHINEGAVLRAHSAARDRGARERSACGAADARPPRCGVEPRGRRAGARGCRRREEGPGGGGGIRFLRKIPNRTRLRKMSLQGRPGRPLVCRHG